MASSQEKNRCSDSLGRITFSRYLYSIYTGNSEKRIMNNIATVFIRKQIDFIPAI